MSICSRRHASRSVRGLSRLCSLSATTASTLASAPEVQQPLLFLYPSCFTHASSRRYHTDLGHGQGRQQQRPRESCLILCSFQASRSRLPAHLHSTTQCCISTTSFKFQESPSSSRADEGTEAIAVTDDTGGIGSDRFRYTTFKHPDVVFRMHRDRPPVDVARTRDKAMIRQRKREIAMSRHMERMTARQKQLLDTTHFRRTISAIKVYDHLKSIVLFAEKSDASRRKSRFNLPAKAVSSLLGVNESNSWIHYGAESCLVTAVLRQGSQEAHIELEGSHRARQVSEDYLLSCTDYTEPEENIAWASNIGSWSRIRDVRELPRPPRWTLYTFSYYVATLTEWKAGRSAMRYIHQDKNTHNAAVGQLLVETFANSDASRVVSNSALERALTFCRHHPELSVVAKQLWHISCRLGLQPDVYCFNQELGRCLVVKDGHRFTDLIDEMKGHAIMPNGHTWALALRYANSAAVRAEVLHFLTKHELMKTQADRESIVEAVVKGDINDYLGTPNAIGAFMRDMSMLFEFDWFTSRVVWRMLRACRVGQPNVDAASDIVRRVRQANSASCSLHGGCLVELFRIAKKAGNLKDALEILTSTIAGTRILLDQQMLELLFLLAWQQKALNLCRLSWLFAALSGKVTFKMQSIISRSLLTSHGEDRWESIAGKLIIGTNLESEGFDKIFPELYTNRAPHSPIDLLLGWAPQGPYRHEQIQLGQLLMERDLNAVRFYKTPARVVFFALLKEAIARDEANTSKPIEEIRDQYMHGKLLQVPLRRRAVLLQASAVRYEGEDRRDRFVANDFELDYDTLEVRAGVATQSEDDVDDNFSLAPFSWLIDHGEHEVVSTYEETTTVQPFSGEEVEHETPTIDVQNEPSDKRFSWEPIAESSN